MICFIKMYSSAIIQSTWHCYIVETPLLFAYCSLGVFALLSVNRGTSGESSLQQLINNTAAEGRAEVLPDSSAAKQAQHFCFVGKKTYHQEDKIYQIKQEIYYSAKLHHNLFSLILLSLVFWMFFSVIKQAPIQLDSSRLSTCLGYSCTWRHATKIVSSRIRSSTVRFIKNGH